MSTTTNATCSHDPDAVRATPHCRTEDGHVPPSWRSATTLSHASTLTEARAQVLVLLARSRDGKAEPVLDDAVAEGIDAAAATRLLEQVAFTGALDEVVRLPAPAFGAAEVTGGAETVLVVGVGESLSRAEDTRRDDAALGATRGGVLARAAGCAARHLSGTSRAVVAFPLSGDADLRAVAAGTCAGAYTWAGRVPAAPQPVREVVLAVPEHLEPATVTAALERAAVLGGVERLARDLVNEPPNRLTPQAFASLAVTAASHVGGRLAAGRLETEVLDEQALREGGFGGIVGVGQGSVHPPRLVRVSWIPQADEVRRVGLIGKGITFDSGGLSLKPPASMPEMKSDMAGAATALAAVLAAAQLGVALRVDAWLALAENMPTTDAQRPSDVVTMYGGTTVEITNTDAEGRLVMADALARAVEDGLDAVLDVATLTGAQIVALGDRVSGVMGTPWLREEVVRAAVRAGEAFWPMPLPEHLRASLDSPYAALRNAAMGSRAGGMLVAGLFLREFVGQVPWAHLDVAGPAFNDKAAWGATPQGGTAAGVATLVEVLAALAADGFTEHSAV